MDGALCSRGFGPSAKIAPLLARHFTVYAYDRRGRGESGDTPPYSPAREVEDVASIRTPTLVMNGSKTDPRLKEAARAIARAIPGARHHELAGQTHNVKPEVLTQAVVDFLDSG